MSIWALSHICGQWSSASTSAVGQLRAGWEVAEPGGVHRVSASFQEREEDEKCWRSGLRTGIRPILPCSVTHSKPHGQPRCPG